MKKIISLLCFVAAAVIIIFSITSIRKRSADPFIHASDLQNDPECVGARAVALVKVPFYANYDALPLSDGTKEYAFFPMIDSSRHGNEIILAGFCASDKEINSIQNRISRLLMEECKKDNSNLDDRKGHVLPGHMVSFESLFDGCEAEADEYLEEYKESFFSLPGVKESVGSSYYNRSALVLMIDNGEVPQKKKVTVTNIISFISAAVLLIISSALFISDNED